MKPMTVERFDALIDELKEAFYFILDDYGISDISERQDERLDTILCRLMREQFVNADED